MDSQSPPNVLVVEDDAAIREALTQLVEDEGYRAAGAANGQEAIAQLRSHHLPCLILLDLMMPVMNGWQFRAEQRRDPRLAPIPTLVISAGSGADQEAAQLDAIGYLKKPVDVDRLLTIVERYCCP